MGGFGGELLGRDEARRHCREHRQNCQSAARAEQNRKTAQAAYLAVNFCPLWR